MSRVRFMIRRVHGLRRITFLALAATFCGVACAIALVSCGGNPARDTAANRPGPADSLQPAPELMMQLEAELERQLALAAAEREAAALPDFNFGTPGPDSHRVQTLEANWTGDPDGGGPALPTGIEFTWVERLQGDYDQNGEVGASDLTPLAQNWMGQVEYQESKVAGETVSLPVGDPRGEGAPNWRLARIDGNGDGELNLADVTEIARNWGNKLGGYALWQYPGGDSERYGHHVYTLPRTEYAVSSPQGPVLWNFEFSVEASQLMESVQSYKVGQLVEKLAGDFFLVSFQQHDTELWHEYNGDIDWHRDSNLANVELPPAPVVHDFAVPNEEWEINPYSSSFASPDGDGDLRLAYHLGWEEEELYPVVVGYTGGGDPAWASRISEYPLTRVYSSEKSADGSMYLSGISYSDPYSSTGPFERFVLKLDPSGNLAWHSVIGAGLTDYGVYVGGYRTFALLIDDKLNVVSFISHWGEKARNRLGFLLQRFDLDGNLLDDRCYLIDEEENSSHAPVFLKAAADSNGSIYVYGEWDNAFGPNYEIFTAKLGANGDSSWSQLLSRAGWWNLNDFCVLPDGRSYLLTGRSKDTSNELIGFSPDGTLISDIYLTGSPDALRLDSPRLAAGGGPDLAVSWSARIENPEATSGYTGRPFVTLINPEGQERISYVLLHISDKPGESMIDLGVYPRELMFNPELQQFEALCDKWKLDLTRYRWVVAETDIEAASVATDSLMIPLAEIDVQSVVELSGIIVSPYVAEWAPVNPGELSSISMSLPTL